MKRIYVVIISHMRSLPAKVTIIDEKRTDQFVVQLLEEGLLIQLTVLFVSSPIENVPFLQKVYNLKKKKEKKRTEDCKQETKEGRTTGG